MNYERSSGRSRAAQARTRSHRTGGALIGAAAMMLSACSASELEPTPETSPVAQVSGAVMTPGWKSLNSANHNIHMDVSTHIACSGDPNGTRDQVLCFRPGADDFESAQVFATNWGTAPTNGMHRILGGAVKSVAILKRSDVAPPPRPDAALYNVFVLSADNVVRVTAGYSDKAYTGTDFKSYSVFRTPVAADGSTLSFKKIMWMNGDSPSAAAGRRYLFAITTGNKLYRTELVGGAWQLHATGVKDMGRTGGIGATFLGTDGRVWYDRFSDDPYDYSGLLPVYPSANITAVGGLYALTDAGVGGNCDAAHCSGDYQRIIHFSWKKWKWEPWYVQLQEAGYDVYGRGFFPLASPQTCQSWDGTTSCSPLVRDSIVDAHDFGSTYNPNATVFGRGFSVGPFVGRLGSRMYFLSAGAGSFPKPFRPCMPGWNSATKTQVSCGEMCEYAEDGSYCGANSQRVCLAGTCQPCGGLSQPCCPARSCPNGVQLGCGANNVCNAQ